MVRSDKSLQSEFVESEDWNKDELSGNSGGKVDRYQLPKGMKARMSFSGSERNSVFTKSAEGHFVDISGNSGLDSASDGRCVAIIDFDRDGFNDILLTNANKPTLSVFRNQIAELKRSNNFVAVRVVGGNTSNGPSSQFTSRDGIGALIRVKADGRTQTREVRCGEGLATQNSNTILFGLANSGMADSIEIRWPSGLSSVIEDVEAGKMVVAFENPQQTESDDGFKIGNYGTRPEQVSLPAIKPVRRSDDMKFLVELGDHNPDGRFQVVVAMATWCESCKSHLPDLDLIKRHFQDRVELSAVPIDPQDTVEKLNAYVSKYKPAYKLLPSNEKTAEGFAEYAAEQLGSAELPFAVILSPSNGVLKTTAGVPTVSDVEQTITDWQE